MAGQGRPRASQNYRHVTEPFRAALTITLRLDSQPGHRTDWQNADKHRTGEQK